MASLPLAVLGALAASRVGMEEGELVRALEVAGVPTRDAAGAIATLRDAGKLSETGSRLELTDAGVVLLLDLHAEVERALDSSPPLPDEEKCPSVPWLTTVQTCWMDALSLNYRVAPDALAGL